MMGLPVWAMVSVTVWGDNQTAVYPEACAVREREGMKGDNRPMNSQQLFTIFIRSACCLALPLYARFIPDGIVKTDDYTVLMAVDGTFSPGLQEFQGGAHGKFYLRQWTNEQFSVAWKIKVPVADDYQVNLLAHLHGTEAIACVKIKGESETMSCPLGSSAHQWDRFSFPKALALKPGEQTVVLQFTPKAPGETIHLEVLSIELVCPSVDKRLRTEANALRVDTAWLQRAGIGVMVHWTSQTQARNGAPKPYTQAVQDFDVKSFAQQMDDCGARFVVLTTSHAEMRFPGPSKTLDALLPGRTASRDLVAELIAELKKVNIRLMLYYHIGSAADPQWLEASGFWKSDTAQIFETWRKVISEIGERYGDGLAGWWFDDGTVNYYYRSAPWKSLLEAARVGNPQRLVGFNSWELPSPTAFQDLYFGEGNRTPSGVGGLLLRNGNGRYPSGSHEGLQSCATLIFESDWIYMRQGQPVSGWQFSVEQLRQMIQEFKAYRNVLIFNFEIAQEGFVSTESIERLKQAIQGVL
jgi:hypothetical protein